MFEVWLTQFVANQDKCPSFVPMKTPLKYIGLQKEEPFSKGGNDSSDPNRLNEKAKDKLSYASSIHS